MAVFGAMRLWEAASVVFFIYVLIAASMSARPGDKRLARLITGGAAGLTVTFLVAWLPYASVVHDWLAPPVLLLLGYWVSGWLFSKPRPAQERALVALDRRLHICGLADRTPRPLIEFLELSYVGVYPLIPIALVLYLLFVPEADPEPFWAVLLITDYICFGFLAVVQTRPPRSIEPGEPWISSVRPFNLQLMGAASIEVNTFPSGHAAEALAAALLLLSAPWPIVAWMFFNTLAISSAAVLGRYHYAADALAGWAVALVVWLLVR